MRVNVSLTTASASSSGRHVTEFLSVQHVTGLRLSADDVIITGRRDVISSAWNYSVLPVYDDHTTRASSSDAWRQIESHAISNSIRVLTAEPAEPFAFSTSSWVAQSSPSCDVDVTHFRPISKMSRSSGGQKVTADVVSRDGGAFEYRIKSMDNPPHIKFLIPGTRSVLS